MTSINSGLVNEPEVYGRLSDNPLVRSPAELSSFTGGFIRQLKSAASRARLTSSYAQAAHAVWDVNAGVNDQPFVQPPDFPALDQIFEMVAVW